MQPINHQDFAVFEAPRLRKRHDLAARAGKAFAALRSIFRNQSDPEQLSERLRRDAGIDELQIECRRIAKAPAIR